MMSAAAQLEEVLALALKLAPKERLQLIERVAASVEGDMAAPAAVEEQPEEHWGQNLLRLLDEMGPIELAHPEIEDPVEWVKTMRRESRQRRLGDLANWGEALDSEHQPE
jgi:hypothetical protein